MRTRTIRETALLTLFCAATAMAALSVTACSLEDPEEPTRTSSSPASLSAAEKEQRERRAEMLLAEARQYSPVERIDKLADVAHVYYDTAAGPKAWREMVFYLLDHSNDDFERAGREVEHFARRCPDSEELLVACLLLYNAPTKAVMENPGAKDAPDRRRVAERGLELWRKVGEHLCGLPQFANNYGVHLETGNAHVYARNFDDAERIWAKVEAFEEPARDMERMNVLLRRADACRLVGRDKAKARALYGQVRSFQDKLSEYVPDSQRRYVDDCVKELEDR